MRIRISHSIAYAYAEPARHITQILRLTPRDHDGQHVMSWRIEPNIDGRLRATQDPFGNIVHNFSADGPIEIRLREDGGHAVVEVADTGRGIPSTAVDLVWDELARADNARDVPGSGIGLSLVRAILRQHGGDVSLRSVEGSGTVVTLRIPT